MSLCTCKDPEVYVEGNVTQYYACKKCNMPVHVTNIDDKKILEDMYSNEWPDPVISMIESRRIWVLGDEYNKKFDDMIEKRKEVLRQRAMNKDKP